MYFFYNFKLKKNLTVDKLIEYWKNSKDIIKKINIELLRQNLIKYKANTEKIKDSEIKFVITKIRNLSHTLNNSRINSARVIFPCQY